MFFPFALILIKELGTTTLTHWKYYTVGRMNICMSAYICISHGHSQLPQANNGEVC